MDIESRRKLNNGMGEGMTRSFDVAVTPVLFSLLGLFIDSRLGTTPAFTLILFVFAVVGVFVRLWYAYDNEMKQEAGKRGWS